MRKPLLLLALASTGVMAQESPKPAEEARLARIAVIDMSRISRESLLGKGYAARIEGLKNEIDAEGTKKQNELNKIDTDIKAMQEELEKQANVLSPEAAEKKSQEIKRKQRDRQAFLEDGQAELERMRQRAQQQAEALNNEFQLKIRPVIEAVAKEKGIDILLDSQAALTLNKVFEISQEVVVKADDAERAARAKAAAPKPAAPPAATAPPAAPKPSPTPTPQP